MFNDRFRIDAIARACSGHASTRHTVVASVSATICPVCVGFITIVNKMIGIVLATDAQNRRVISRNSLDGPSPAAPDVGQRGSSAMPQIGQEPGPCFTIFGCMGQVYSIPEGGRG